MLCPAPRPSAAPSALTFSPVILPLEFFPEPSGERMMVKRTEQGNQNKISQQRLAEHLLCARPWAVSRALTTQLWWRWQPGVGIPGARCQPLRGLGFLERSVNVRVGTEEL